MFKNNKKDDKTWFEAYVLICKVYNEQMDLFESDNEIAAYNTIQIVRNSRLLKEFLKIHGLEFKNILKELYKD